jgi:predicted DNA-binding transcriptional regulator AlpA
VRFAAVIRYGLDIDSTVIRERIRARKNFTKGSSTVERFANSSRILRERDSYWTPRNLSVIPSRMANPRDCQENTLNAFEASATDCVPAERREAGNARVRSTNAVDDLALIDEKQLCADLGISSVTATKWRAKAAGPPFIKVGRLVRYRRTDVEAWLASRTIGRRSV